MCICAHIWKLNCLLGFLTSCLETELDSATVPGSCFEAIPQLASIPTTGFPELRTRIWSFILLTQEDHGPVLCPLNASTVRAVFNLLQQAIHHDNLQSRGRVATCLQSRTQILVSQARPRVRPARLSLPPSIVAPASRVPLPFSMSLH